MQYDYCEWDDESDPTGNTRHVAHNGVTPEEFQEVLDAAPRRAILPSNTDPDNMTWVGETLAGQELRIVFVLDEDDDFIHVRPVTAYDPTRLGD